ncbi:hypothetical protein B0I35DRAFT_199402 [Stachybotrys elegans]|uniref:Secreted protein n=1 Tax=Stachybotrys elegans TaxID=80388 RepID=A0A8K0SXT6_9HYPO|nr:hypothetical protein B0I35DRAFT_199402 [Stachybotrys elegans]
MLLLFLLFFVMRFGEREVVPGAGETAGLLHAVMCSVIAKCPSADAASAYLDRLKLPGCARRYQKAAGVLVLLQASRLPVTSHRRYLTLQSVFGQARGI